MGELIVLRHGETEWSRSGRHTGRTDVPLTARGEAAAAPPAPGLAPRALCAGFTTPRRPRAAGGGAAPPPLAPGLARRDICAVFTSPAGRAVRTGELAGLIGPDVPWPVKVDPDLQEWDYGGYEGQTTADIRKERPGWNLWRDGVIPGDARPPGETIGQVGDRGDGGA